MPPRLSRFDRLREALEPLLPKYADLANAWGEYESAGEDGAEMFVARVAPILPSAARLDTPLPVAARALVGAGFAATLRFACLTAEEREQTIVIAADDEPWTDRGPLRMGQRVADLACAALPVDVLDLSRSADLSTFCPARTFGVALRLSQLSLGMQFFAATLESVALVGEEAELRLRSSSPTTIRVRHLDLSLGVGPPRRMDNHVLPDWDVMHSAGTAMYAEEALKADRRLHGRVAVGSAGLTAAWVAEKALRDGCTEVWLLGSGHARWRDDRARAENESNRQLRTLRDTQRTEPLLRHVADFGADAHRARVEGIDGDCCVGTFFSGSYRRVVSSGSVVSIELDAGSPLEVDCFVSAAGQDDGWRSRDAAGLVDRPPVGALGLRDWELTAAQDGAPVGVNDRSERRRALGAAGTRATRAVMPKRCHAPEPFVEHLIKKRMLPVTGNTPDGVPYQAFAIRAHPSKAHGPLAPDALALANLGTADALSTALELAPEQAAELLAIRKELMDHASPAEDDEPDAFTGSEEEPPLPPSWWSLEHFKSRKLSPVIAQRLSDFEPSRDV